METNPTPKGKVNMDKTEAARCLAKVNAYLTVGKVDEAQEWWDKLTNMAANAGLKV